MAVSKKTVYTIGEKFWTVEQTGRMCAVLRDNEGRVLGGWTYADAFRRLGMDIIQVADEWQPDADALRKDGTGTTANPGFDDSDEIDD